MFTFRDWAEFRPEDREQRVLNEKRVPHIAKYILDNEDGYLFASITASYKCESSSSQRRVLMRSAPWKWNSTRRTS